MSELILRLEKEFVGDDYRFTIHGFTFVNDEVIIKKENIRKRRNYFALAATIAHYGLSDRIGAAYEPQELLGSLYNALGGPVKYIDEIFGPRDKADFLERHMKDGEYRIAIKGKLETKAVQIGGHNAPDIKLENDDLEKYLRQLCREFGTFFTLDISYRRRLSQGWTLMRNALNFQASEGDIWKFHVVASAKTNFALFWVEWPFPEYLQKEMSGKDNPWRIKPIFPYRLNRRNKLVPRVVTAGVGIAKMDLTIPASPQKFTVRCEPGYNISIAVIGFGGESAFEDVYESVINTLKRVDLSPAAENVVRSAILKLKLDMVSQNFIDPDDYDDENPSLSLAEEIALNYRGVGEEIEVVVIPVGLH